MWPCRSGKRLLHTALLQERCKCGGSILLAAVAVKCQIGRGISFAESYPKCTGDQIRAGIAGYAIADDFPGKEVENDAQIKPVIVELEVCNITDPCLIRMFCGKLLLQQVLLAVFLMLFKLLFGIKSNAAQIELLHDRSNALGADSDTTFGQCNANLFGTIPLAAVVESLLYQTHELCLLLVALAAVRTAKDVVVKCTASDIQCFAQLMNTISIIRLMVEIFQNGKSLLQGNNTYMSIFITKIKLYNFRRFREFVIEPNTKNNILIGDNESGKSTILEAIDLVSGGNNRRVEAIGLDNLLNIEAVTEFINSDRCYADLPKLRVELYLSGASDPSVNGENNSDKIECDGIKLVCEPNEDYKTEITFAMDAQSDYFPYEYYSIRFSTFADQVYTGYKRKLRCAMVNSDNMDSEYATNDFIKRTYYQYTGDDAKERAIFRSKYRQMRKVFCADSLKPLNDRIPQEKHYTFGLKNSPASALENNLMIYEDEISIDNKGTGRQIFIKTDFALEHAGSNVDVILLEEPETHLSHVNLKKLIQKIAKTQAGQIFIATHNSLISTRLELNNVIILHCDGEKRPVTLKSLNLETAAYFKKTPPASITEFVLSRKTILVEGPAEYILFEKFYETVTGHVPENDDVQILDVRGLSFKRYLDIACLTKGKVY